MSKASSLTIPPVSLVTSKNQKEQHLKSTHIIRGFKLKLRHLLMKISILILVSRTYKNPFLWLRSLQYLVNLRRRYFGDFRLKKMVRVDGKYYISLHTPGWNDSIYKRFIVSELNHFKPSKAKGYRFNHVHLAVTNKCSLQCDHCYAWDMLNSKDKLSEEDLNKAINKVQSMGACQIYFTGGEPLLKVEMLTRLIKNAENDSNFWINTSGYRLTSEKAKQLKEAGLTGLHISLDHYEADKHNAFRKHPESYRWAVQGARNAIENDLVVALSVCVDNEFITETNLLKYMALAKSLGVHFVQILEPKKVGHYKNKQVALAPEKVKILEDFYVRMNFSNDFLDFPILCYHEYYKRRHGCMAGGNRSMYVDTEGTINACAFCHTSSGNIFDKDFEYQIKEMRKLGCSSN